MNGQRWCPRRRCWSSRSPRARRRSKSPLNTRILTGNSPPGKGRVQPPGQSSWALPLKAKGYWGLYMISASIRIKAVVGHCVTTQNPGAGGRRSGAGQNRHRALLGNLGEGELIEDAGLQGGMLTGRRRSLRRGRIGTRWFHRRELAEVRAHSTCIERLLYQSFPEGTRR